MKIGIIFFGLPRHTQTTYPSIEQFIFNELAEHEVFIESCFSYQAHISNAHSNENIVLDKENYTPFDQFPHLFISPDSLLDQALYEKVLKFGDKWKDNGKSLQNLLIQLNCIKKAYLRCKKNDCDFYFFVRPDLLIEDTIPIKAYLTQYVNSKTLMLPSWQWFKGINDRFAVTSKLAADTFGLRYDEALSYCEINNQPLHSEAFLFHQLTKNNVKIKTCSAKMYRVRANGKIEQETFSVVKRMGGYKKAFLAQMNQMELKQRVIGILKIILYFFKIR